MPADIGQKIFRKLGINKHEDQPNSPEITLPGKAAINDDERALSSHSPNAGTYPRLCRLHDGSILSSFTRFPNKQRSLCVARSTDNGQTFEDLSEVTRRTGDTDNMFLCEVTPGTILAAFRNHDRDEDVPTHFRITVCRSTDGGQSWEFASQAAEKVPPHGIWEPFMRVGHRGEVQLYYSDVFAPENQCTMQVISDDHGTTWSKPKCLHGKEDPLRDGMIGIAPTIDNGREALVMVFETTTHGTFDIKTLISYDDGYTWGNRGSVYYPKSGHNAGSPQIASFDDGSMVIIFMSDEGAKEVKWPKNASIEAVFAGPPQDGKIQWSQPSRISDAPGNWPGIMALDGHTALVAYEHEGPRARTITWHT